MGRATPPTGSLLLKPCGPAAVTGLVAFVVVYAVQGLALWPLAHVGVEVGEVMPAFADLNSPAAIVLVLLVLLAFASLQHGGPRDPSRGATHSVDSGSLKGRFSHVAATTCSGSREDVRLTHGNFPAAVAFENPKGTFVFVPLESNGCKPPKALTCQVNSGFEASTSLRISASEVDTPDGNDVAAIAFAFPQLRSVPVASREAENREQMKLLAA